MDGPGQRDVVQMSVLDCANGTTLMSLALTVDAARVTEKACLISPCCLSQSGLGNLSHALGGAVAIHHATLRRLKRPLAIMGL